MQSDLTPHELGRLNMKQLVEYGRQAMQSGQYGRAAVLFREAVHRAPMRQDLKEYLAMAVEGSLIENQMPPRPQTPPPSASKPQAPPPPRASQPTQRPAPTERRAPADPPPARPAPEPWEMPERRPTPPPRPEVRPDARTELRAEPRIVQRRPEPRPAPPGYEPRPEPRPANWNDGRRQQGGYPAEPRPEPLPEPHPEPRRDGARPEPRFRQRPAPPPEPWFDEESEDVELPAPPQPHLPPPQRPRPHREAREVNGTPRLPEPLPPPRPRQRVNMPPGARPEAPTPARPQAPQAYKPHPRPKDFNRRHQRGPLSAILGACVGFLMFTALGGVAWFYFASTKTTQPAPKRVDNTADLNVAIERATAYTRKDEYSKAIDIMLAQPDSIERNRVLAEMYNEQGDLQILRQKPPRYEMAIQNYLEAKRFDPNNVKYRNNLADAYFQLAVSQSDDRKASENYLNLAQEQCDFVLGQDAKNLAALDILKRLAVRKRDDALLAGTLNRIIAAAPDSPKAAEARQMLEERKLRVAPPPATNNSQPPAAGKPR